VTETAGVKSGGKVVIVVTADDGELQEELNITTIAKALYRSLNCLKRSLITPLHEFDHL
jgi:hypothetical protein